MGCCFSSAGDDSGARQGSPNYSEGYQRPKWKATPPMTRSELMAKREEFWHTQPAYGGNKVVWDTLKGALEADHATTRMLLDAAEVIVATPDMSEVYDSQGFRYELPPYVLNEPTNLIEDAPPATPTSPSGVQLADRA